MRTRMCTGLAALLFLSASAFAQDEKVSIEWKFKKGETLKYDMSQTMATEFGGMEMDQTFGFVFSEEVQEVAEDGTATLKVTYTRVRVTMTGMMESDYDSDRDKEKPEDQMGSMFAAFLGKSFTMKMSKRGEILELKGMKELMEKVMEEAQGGDEGMPGMGEMLKDMYSDEQMKDMMQLSYGLLPKEAVKKGDSWKSEGAYPLPMMGKLSLKNESTLKDVKDGGKVAVIEQKTDIKFAGGDDDPTGGMFTIEDAKAVSEILWGLDSGRMTSMKTTTELKMDMGGQEIAMTMKMVMKLLDSKGGDTPSEDKRPDRKDN